MKFFKVCLLSELLADKPKVALADGISICVVASTKGEIFAFENRCTHQDRPLANGKWDGISCLLTCPFHQAVFSISEKGAVKIGPAVLPLEIFPVEIKQEIEGAVIYVGLEDA